MKEKDYFLHVQDLYGVGMSEELALAAFISLCSGALERPLQEQTAILGSMTIGGSVGLLENLAGLLLSVEYPASLLREWKTSPVTVNDNLIYQVHFLVVNFCSN